MVGFHWTKVHERGTPVAVTSTSARSTSSASTPPSVAAASDGHSRSPVCTTCSRAGLRTVLLYVDAANTAAVQLYASLGFALDHADTEYAAE